MGIFFGAVLVRFHVREFEKCDLYVFHVAIADDRQKDIKQGKMEVSI
jgi:hypothetical protein